MFQNLNFLFALCKKFARIKFMRIDKFLNTTNITKRRAIAEDMCKSGVVFINDKQVKASKEVKIGDIISLQFHTHSDTYKVLALPSTKNIPKASQADFVEKL